MKMKKRAKKRAPATPMNAMKRPNYLAQMMSQKRM